MATYTVYGIPNCDTVQKTLKWLAAHKISVQFHDYKTQGITTAQLKKWSSQVGWELLLNKKSATWRALTPGEQAPVTNEKNAIALMAAATSIIKRPVIEKDGRVIAVGFDEKRYAELF